MPWPTGVLVPGARALLATSAALAVLGLAGCADPPPRVPMPATDAAPAVVVRAYLDALEVEDVLVRDKADQPWRIADEGLG